MRQTVEGSIIQLKEIQNHLESLRNILSSDNLPRGKYLKDSVIGCSDVSVPNYESRIMEEEKAGFNFQVTEKRVFSSNQKIEESKFSDN